jgi:hypothetical protein
MTLTIKKSEKRKPVGVCDKEKSATAILTALVLLLTIPRSVRKHESNKKSLKTL